METSLVQVFDNPEFGKIRTALINGVPYVNGKDVATILGYADTFAALKQHVDPRDKITLTRKDFEKMASNQETGKTPVSDSVNEIFGYDTFGGAQRATFINESGFYSLIFSSKLPKAQEFAHWVTSEVLPALRKYGFYSMRTDKDIEIYKKIAADPQFLIEIGYALKAANDKVAVLTEENRNLEQQISELTPKADFCNNVLQAKNLICVSVIAKDYGYKAGDFNKLLEKLGVQYKTSSGVWLPTQNFQRCGWMTTVAYPYTNSKGENCTKIYSKWTHKGRYELYLFLKNLGYYPTMEHYEKHLREAKAAGEVEQDALWF